MTHRPAPLRIPLLMWFSEKIKPNSNPELPNNPNTRSIPGAFLSYLLTLSSLSMRRQGVCCS
eukprot:740401-Amorphochlora_amoeboformis.AAC.1